MLLTLQDTEERRRYLNARETLGRLSAMRAVPVINENDTVATSEIRYGDNDRLAARVATMASADLLILLSDVAGLYDAPPQESPSARLIPVVERLTPQIEAMAGGAASEASRGGMRTKIEAARIAGAGGAHMVIADGRVAHPIARVGDGGPCTWFLTPSNPVTARKAWIGGTLELKGSVTIDAGAAKALKSGKSLLPAGVKRVEGGFARGDCVAIRDESGVEIGRGLIAYDAKRAERICGRNSRDIAKVLGAPGRAEMIHRDDMALSRAVRSASRLGKRGRADMDKPTKRTAARPLSRRTLLIAAASVAGGGRVFAARASDRRPRSPTRTIPHGVERCEICAPFLPPDQCRVVVGPVSRQGWCKVLRGRRQSVSRNAAALARCLTARDFTRGCDESCAAARPGIP